MDRHERISALIDDEVSEFEVKQILNEMLKDDSQRQIWQRYHVIRDVIQGNLPDSVRANFADDVMSRVYAEELVDDDISAASKEATGWRTSTYGAAIAASLALMAVMIYQFIPTQTATPIAPLAFVNQSNSTPATQYESAALEDIQTASAQSDYTTTQQISSANNPALNSYLVNHAEYAGSQAMIPYARIVGYNMDPR